MVERRQFLGFMGMAAVGGKSAVKEVAANLPVKGLGKYQDNDYYKDELFSNGVFSKKSLVEIPSAFKGKNAKRLFIEQFGFPEHLLCSWKQQSRNIGCLDVDLQVNRSMSLAAKMNVQRDRNFEKFKKDFLRDSTLGDKFREKFPWASLIGIF